MSDHATTFTFTTTDPQQARRWMASEALCHIIHELAEDLRQDCKYAEVRKDSDYWRERLHEYLRDNNVGMEEIWN